VGSAKPFRFGVCRAEFQQLEFFGDVTLAGGGFTPGRLRRLEVTRGGTRVEIDFSIFRGRCGSAVLGPVGGLRRLAALQSVFARHRAMRGIQVVTKIITSGTKYSAVDAYRAAHIVWKV